MARDGEIIQRQHFVITETQFAIQSQVTYQNETARNVYCGCNNNAIFSDSYIHVSYRCRMPATLIWPRQSIAGWCQSSEMAALLNSLSFVSKMLFLPKYHVI